MLVLELALLELPEESPELALEPLSPPELDEPVLLEPLSDDFDSGFVDE